jgi:ATP-dependent Clp protease ATP-binding subunit ClpA
MKAILPSIDRPGQLADWLKKRVLGQDHAIDQFASGIELAHSVPPRKNRARSFVLLLGPTGTGKTEMVLLVGEALGGRDKVERIDLGEYQHADAPLRLLGSPEHASVLGEALDRLETRGGGILLLDEIEKAHPSVIPVLLGFDAGRVTTHGGRVADLSRVHVVMTSNLGSAEAAQMEAAPEAAVERHILKTAERAMRPEVFARFSQRIVLRRLGPADQHRIAQLMLQRELAWRSSLLRRPLLATRDAIAHIAARGFTRDLGARPLRRAVEEQVGTALLGVSQPVEENASDRLSLALLLDTQGGRLVALPVASMRENAL